ncbi:MAG: hypothetical protein A2Y55_10830 [Actinobacteria bacterium RBG_16_68_12]|nr:MAG: hypothetical protein A2Y55_10830 [Actinobacteria bacterium RBG_16_68_12]
MGGTRTMGAPAGRPFPLILAVATMGVLVTAIGAGLLVREATSGGLGARQNAVIEHAAPVAQDRSLVLSAETAQLLGHRPGMTASHFIRVRAFGSGLTAREVLRSPARDLPPHRGLAPIRLIRS